MSNAQYTPMTDATLNAIDEALNAIREAIRAGQNAAHLIIKAQDLGATRYAISEVIIEAAQSLS